MFFVVLGSLVAVLLITYLLGPSIEVPTLSAAPYTGDLPATLQELEEMIISSENSVSNIKPNNEARIVWADSFRYKKSPYSVVYLHGFSASQGEGFPVHMDFAKRYGCNMYLARLQAHGLANEEPMVEMEPSAILLSAKQAVAIGKQIGEKVIVMSTSTGGTLGLFLASGDPDIDALICYSPNIEIHGAGSSLLTKPWGLHIARLATGGKYREFKDETDERAHQYWTTRYRLEAVISLKALMEATMKPSTFQSIQQPLLLAYYYKDEENQDATVSVPHMLEMFDALGTPNTLKRKVALPDVGVHPLASEVYSKDIEGVEQTTFAFAEEILQMAPLE